MYKSINQWSFAGGMDAKACLLAAKAAGFAGFEPAFDAEGPSPPKRAIPARGSCAPWPIPRACACPRWPPASTGSIR